MRKKIDEPMPIAFVAASYLISVVPQSLHAYAITRVAGTMFLYFSFSFGKRFILYILLHLTCHCNSIRCTALDKCYGSAAASMCRVSASVTGPADLDERPESLCDTSLRLNGTQPNRPVGFFLRAGALCLLPVYGIHIWAMATARAGGAI